MSRSFQAGATLPDFALPAENGTVRRLSEIQGEDPMVLLLGRGLSDAKLDVQARWRSRSARTRSTTPTSRTRSCSRPTS